MTPPFPTEVRERALALYVEHGPSEAARRMRAEGHDVKSATVRTWATRAGVTATAREAQAAGLEAAKLSNEAKRERLRDELLDLARDTASKARAASKARERRDHAGSLAIFVDKFELLDGRATSRVERLGVDPAERLRALRDQARDELAERRSKHAA